MNEIDLFRSLVGKNNILTIETIAFNIAMTTVLALFIFFVYKKTFSGVLYSLSFNVTLVIIALTTAIVIMLIGSNLAVSLGMVGALSIVRFRSAIKEPRDLAFLFWSIAVGLASGTGAFLIAIVGSIFIFIIIFIFSKAVSKDNCYLLVLKGKEIDIEKVERILNQYEAKHKLRMQNLNQYSAEVTFEIFLKKQNGHIILDHLKGTEIDEVNLVSFNGEITG
ncbi:MAG: DUF4956 domain-containing protein [Christensenellales bacterium]|jgi:uncharacterized membrane protein YhiD involved in acid resistance